MNGFIDALEVRWWRAAASLGLAVTVLVYGQAALHPLPLPRGLDPTLRLAGWAGLAAEMQAAADGSAFLSSEEYSTAALLAWWAPGPVLAAGARWRLVDLPHPAESREGLLLVSERRREGPDPALWASAEPAGELSRRRGTIEIERYRLFHVVPRAGAPLALLPDR